jgi:AcrR family transcriptional regulator
LSPKRTEAQAAETRANLIRVARERFGSAGFGSTNASEIAERAGVTRGALLHHFVDKEGLFAAVLEQVESDVADRVMTQALTGATPVDCLRRGFDAFLGECLDPGVSQIMLIDGPSVLGWDIWHQIDSQYGFQPVVDTVSAAVAAKELESDDPDALAHLLLGALAEAATLVGRSDEPEATRVRMARSLNQLIDGLGHSAPRH